jgi:hypothetical protein
MPLVNATLTGRAWSLGTIDHKSILPTSSSIPDFFQGICLGGPTSIKGDDSYIRHLQYGITKSLSEGNPGTPSLQLVQASMWKFRWVVKPGFRRVSVRVKQGYIYTGQRPTMTIKANSSVGILSDVVATAAESTDWVTIGPTSFTSTGTDVVFVELRNNLLIEGYPAYFDHIIVV